MHKHYPGQYRNSFIRFVAFVVSPVKVYNLCIDGADYCHECGSEITVPDVYYGPYLKVVYILVSAFCGYLFSDMHYYIMLPVALLLALFHHIASSFIFACISWEPYNPKKYDIKYASARAAEDIKQKVKCLFIGYFILSVCCRYLT